MNLTADNRPTYNVCRYILGIDPDKDASGIALWDRKTRTLERLELMTLPVLVDFCQRNRETVFVYLEAGHQINFIWGLQPGWSLQKAASKARDVGVNHGVAYCLIQCFEHHHIGYICVEPRGKKGDVKFTPELLKQLTGWETTNKELLSAAKLVVGV